MLIFVFGEDKFNAREKVRVMREAFLDKFDASGTNLVEFPLKDQKKPELGSVAQAIQSPPFLAEKRMVVIRGLLSEVTRKPDAKPWIEIFEKIPETTIVVLLDEVSAKKAVRHSILLAAKDRDDSHEYVFEPLSESQAVSWATGEARKLDLNISPALCRSFVQMAGVDAWILSLELKKLASFCRGREVTQGDLDLMVRPSADDQLFDLLDAMSQRNEGRVKKMLEQQRLFGMPDAQLFGMLVRQMRLLIAASDFFEKNASAGSKDLANSLGVHPFVAKKLTAQQGQFSKDELIRVQKSMMDNDFYVKTGILQADQAVDMAVIPMSTRDIDKNG